MALIWVERAIKVGPAAESRRHLLLAPAASAAAAAPMAFKILSLMIVKISGHGSHLGTGTTLWAASTTAAMAPQVLPHIIMRE